MQTRMMHSPSSFSHTPAPSHVVTEPCSRLTLWVCVALFIGLHFLLPFTAAPLSQSEPSFAGEVFPWLSKPTRESLGALQASAATLKACWPFALVCVGLFAVYAKILRLMRTEPSRGVQRIVFVAGAIAMLSYIFAPVMFSTDIFAYAMYGRVMSHYGGNPYAAAMPFPDTDPFFVQYGIEYVPSWYGPVWTFISAGVTWCTGENLGMTVLAFRLVSIASALATGGFIWSSLRKYSPANTTRGLVLFLWNPLLVMETGFSGHNDSVMLAFAACGVWLHLRGRKAAAVMAFTFSALVKLLTGMLVPLYLVLVMREAKTWPERMRFVLRSTIPVTLTALALFHLAKADTSAPVAHSATAPDFYLNNFHGLIFQRLRLAVGEDAASARVPVLFQPSWVRLRHAVALRSGNSPSAPIVAQAPVGAHLLTLSPPDDDWLRVYDPATHRIGYFTGAAWDEAERPSFADHDAEAREREKPVIDHPMVRKANAILRLVTWLGFAGFGLFAAWRTRNFTEFLVWSGASLLASYFFIITEIWPWYVNWALALGAFAPGRLPARLAMMLSAGMLTLYLTLGFHETEFGWLFELRSLFATVLPLLLFTILWLVRWRKAQPTIRPV